MKAFDPKLPSAEEVTEHELTHLRCRFCCSHCVRCKGKHLAIEDGQEASLASAALALGLLLPCAWRREDQGNCRGHARGVEVCAGKRRADQRRG